MPAETILSILPSSDPTHRLLVVLKTNEAAGSLLELHQQSWGDGVGWFTQTRLPIQREQLALLRSALGQVPVPAAPLSLQPKGSPAEGLAAEILPFPARRVNASRQQAEIA